MNLDDTNSVIYLHNFTANMKAVADSSIVKIFSNGMKGGSMFFRSTNLSFNILTIVAMRRREMVLNILMDEVVLQTTVE